MTAKHMPGVGNTTRKESRINPAAMSIEQIARVLSHAGKHTISQEDIEFDIKDGAPTNADNTINLIKYTAWLASQRGL